VAAEDNMADVDRTVEVESGPENNSGSDQRRNENLSEAAAADELTPSTHQW